ncbi:MAG: hypothetical protein IPK27_19935 [Rhodanobacteraceae bacterium]|nr:hypothetical protein [Rhodanobacteraceae bacterium]
MRLWYFLLAFLSLASGAVLATELRLKEASALQLHGIDDYLKWVPMEVLDEAARTEIIAKGESTTQDFVAANNRYSLFHKFEGERAFVRSLLILVSPSESPPLAFSEWETKAAAELLKLGVTLKEMICPDEWMDDCSLRQVVNSEGIGVGNLFVLRKGRSIYSVTILGLSSFDRTQDAREFLEMRAIKNMAFNPTTLAAEAGKEKQKILDIPKESARGGIFWALLLFYALVYSALYWGGALINRVAGRVIARRRLVGLVGTSLLAVSAGFYVRGQVVGTGVLNTLDSFEMGRVEGELIGMYLSPLLMLALGVGLSVWRESRNNPKE